MGVRGQIPKRSDEVLGHISRSQADEYTKVPGANKVEVPEPDERWHRIAHNWYTSLAKSGQSQFFEPSDWAAAQYVAEAMSRHLEMPKFNAMLFSHVWSAMDSLLTTEGARRRVRLELQRGQAAEDDNTVTDLREYQSRLSS